MRRPTARGLSLLDLVVSLALLGLLAWLVHFDWPSPPGTETRPPAAVPGD